MFRLSLTVPVVISMFIPGAVPASQAPDLSGTWVLASSQRSGASGAPGAGGGGSAGGMTSGATSGMTAGGGGGGSAAGGGARMGATGGGQPPEIVVTQTAAALTIERIAPSPMKWVYKLDGSESVNTNGRTTTRTTSRWEGRTLVTEGTQTVTMDTGEVEGTIKEVRSIAADGSLTIETTRTAEGMTSAAPVLTQTYKKK